MPTGFPTWHRFAGWPMTERLERLVGQHLQEGSATPVPVRVEEVLVHHETLKTFVMEAPFSIAPGQFVMLWLPGVEEKPFSPSLATQNWRSRPGRIELTVRAVGAFTHALMGVKPGQLLGLRGPFGRGFSLEPFSLLVGGGMGIAPLRYLAEALDSSGLPFHALLGARTGRDLLFTDWFSRRSASLFTDDGSAGTAGLVTQSLDAELSSGLFRNVCACGPEPMLLAVMKICETRSVPYQFGFERYMKCGIGICGQCCMDGSGIRLCKEGPVLTAHELAGITELGLPHRDASGARPARPGV